jgi:hypothetical protein
MGRAGRPRIHIDWAEFEKLCEIQCSLEEIAFWYRCSPDTIERAVKRQYKALFAVVKEEKAIRGRVAIRRALMQLALKGNLGAIIWASKNYLGMADKLDQNLNSSGPAPQVIVSIPSNGREAITDATIVEPKIEPELA